MAELPERKVLKQILERLKTKTIRSKSVASDQAKSSIKAILEVAKMFKEDEKTNMSRDEKQISEQVRSLVHSIGIDVRDLVARYESALDDMLIYIESLENYSKELDKTLSDIFEQATKNAEEEIQKQKELMPKKDDSYIK